MNTKPLAAALTVPDGRAAALNPTPATTPAGSALASVVARGPGGPLDPHRLRRECTGDRRRALVDSQDHYPGGRSMNTHTAAAVPGGRAAAPNPEPTIRRHWLPAPGARLISADLRWTANFITQAAHG
jgi:hypothetical protein